jgi:very-short-patch-repair endonuclease
MTPPELALWKSLRDRRVAGMKFRREHPIGPYFADFYCAAAGLVVEIDGRRHDVKHDAQRDAYMDERGLAVLRVRAVDVRDRKGDVLRLIVETAERRMKAFADAPPRPAKRGGVVERSETGEG